ncbi:hypothetical protein Pmani_012923 [Petrolisthes manimaculis]|uniref:RNA-directed DNA polymerase n=1 Tax=Petrolisthes manimaculis TaxID=1843537 RepID=A0AAE1UA29_9EUCA|nr:hypothetical protein Pmani_012923 [Petrolisthes manimaculis]
MPVYGHLEKFQKDQDWGRYIAVLKNYFGADGITDGVKKRQILLASVGLETYDLICALVAPLPPEEKTFEELVTIVQDHVRPPPSKIVSRFRFYTLSRREGESISSFVVKVRQAAQDCKFTDLNEHLRDRFIVAIGDDKIQARLLSMSYDVTFAKALQVAIAMESALANTEDIQAPAAASSVSGASAVCEVREVHSTKRDQCYGCGGDHYRRDCKFKNAVCHACGRKGHISRVCQATVRNQCQNSPPIKRNNQSKRKSVRSTHLVEQEDTGAISEDSELECYTICNAICNLGEYKGSPVKLYIEKTAKLRFFKARPVPYAIKKKVQKAIEKNVQLGIWESTDYSDWAAPLVPILKSDGSIPIHHEYHEYLTVNTHMGLFKVKRLPFGVNVAVCIFQRIICNVLRGLEGVSVYLDDILVTGKDDREHLQNLENVLIRLRDAGLQVKKKKCSFLQQSVEYLGYRIDAEGLHPTDEKVRAVKEAPSPSNKAELRSFLYLINYYAKFLPNLGSVLSPLYHLTKNDVGWMWGNAEQEVFRRAGDLISTSQVLVHYNPDLPLLLVCDASPRGLASPTMASHRVRRWALTLSAYDYNIQYKKGKDNSNADALSRLPLPDLPRHVHTSEELNLVIGMLNSSKDPGGVYGPYYIRRYEISLKDGCLLWGSRVIISEGSRGAVLRLLHDTRIGITRMKALGRSYVWWPGIDKDIEGTVEAYQECDKHQNAPELAELHPWEWPSVPWSRIHVEHAGPFMGKLFLIVVDSHSKWMEVKLVSSTSTNVAIDALNSIFATHGLSVTLVSDNGTAFTSEEFGKYCEKSGIKHIRSAPRHPSTNGLAERAVQTFKSCMKKMEESLPWSVRLNRFLFKYRNTPQSTTP